MSARCSRRRAVALRRCRSIVALTDAHLDGQPAALVISTAAAALAVSALALQPLLAGIGRLRWHRVLGAVALALVLLHLGGLFVESARGHAVRALARRADARAHGARWRPSR